MNVIALILAAGAGRRMGGPKALLRVRGESFLARTALVLSRPGVSRVVAVLGHDAARVAAEAGAPRDLILVENHRHAEGMMSSVLRGLDEAEALGAEALLLHPVDHPLVDPSTVDLVVAALASGALIVVPSHHGRRGHPAGFARTTWPALRSAPADRGARFVLADHPDWILHVPGDPGSVAGIDTPADYGRLCEA